MAKIEKVFTGSLTSFDHKIKRFKKTEDYSINFII